MKMFFRGFFTIIFGGIFLSGCSTLPIKRSQNYSLEDIYKRIAYKVDGRYRVINIFYATSRQIDYGPDLSPDFKPELAKETTYGTLDMRIDPRLRIGEMLPDKIKKNGLIEMKNIKRLDADAFIKELSEAVKASPHNSVLVLIFGYKDGFEATAMKAAYFSYLLDVDTPVLLFDWPGDQSVDMFGYEKAQSLASASGPYLADVIAKVVREIKPKKLWIEASSLGAQVICDAFDTLYKYPDFTGPDLEIDHVLLAAPDVSGGEFTNKFKKEFEVIAKKITAYVSSEDDALLMSGFINQDNRLGRIKLRVTEPKQLEEAKELLYLKSLAPDRLTAIDVTPINTASFKHGYYLECSEFYDDFYMRILDAKPNVNRWLYLLKTKDGEDYWVMQSSK
ncbi:MAG: alpha/beta hydrolase [Candidatus Omnitrophica bacterium]|nr:alpha/beta hydrolase [Candidatus Omnitrophota bacterium]